MENHSPTPEGTQRRRPRLQLRILLAIAGLTFAVFLLTQLDRAMVKRLGPWAESVYDQFNGQDSEQSSLSDQRLTADVQGTRLYGGLHRAIARAVRTVWPQGPVLDQLRELLRQQECQFRRPRAHAPRERLRGSNLGNSLRDSQVTDDGLRVLKGITNLRHVSLEYSDPGMYPPRIPCRPD